MAQVIQQQSRTPQILMDLMNKFQQSQADDEQKAFQEKQFGLQQQQFGDTSRRTDLLASQQKDTQAQARAKAFFDNTVPALKNDPKALAQEAAKFIKADPEAGAYLSALAQQRPLTPEDQAQTGAAQFRASAVAAANAGTQDVQKLDVGRQVAGTPFTPQSFADAQQRQPEAADTKTPYGQTLNIEGQRAPGAVPVLQAKTQKDINAANLSAEAPGRAAQVGLLNAQTGAAQAETKLKQNQASLMAPGGDYQKQVAASVIQDPQSYFALPPDQKKVAMQALNGRVPSKLGSAEVERMNAAVFGRQILDDSDAMVKKWVSRGIPITGPALGRFNEKTGQFGEGIMPQVPEQYKAEYEQDIGQLRDWLVALPVQEAKALAGGRTAVQVIQMIQSASPSMSKSANMFAGSTKGLRTRFDGIDKHLTAKQWGGKPPTMPGVNGGATPSTGGASNDPLGILGGP